jgi:hypothetical protein
MTMSLNIAIVWDVTSCSLAEITDASGKLVFSIFAQERIAGQKFFPPRRYRQHISSQLPSFSTGLHGVIFQKTIIFT